ncbi:hypothetical protein ACQY0O_006031 [Thecaphora frezii]
MTTAVNTSVDVLLLGSGWSSTFILPLLGQEGVSCAFTSRRAPTSDEAANGQYQFELSDPLNPASLRPLPRASTVVVIFPIKNPDLASALVEEYERLHGATRWIQLGSTGIWPGGSSTSTSPFDATNPRAASEQRLIELDQGGSEGVRRTCVLNLAGLYGGTRQPRNFAVKVGGTKEKLALKGSVHFVHGRDVALAIHGVHRSNDKGWGRRWIVSDGNVYDWWQLVAVLQPTIPGEPRPDIGSAWVSELMAEYGIAALPRPIAHKPEEKMPHFLERALDGHDFWEAIGAQPTVASVLQADAVEQDRGEAVAAVYPTSNGQAQGQDSFRSNDEKKGERFGTGFHPRRFNPSFGAEEVEALIARLRQDLERGLPAEAALEGSHERFGLRHADFQRLAHAWIPFLEGKRSSAGEARRRRGPDHDTWAARQAQLQSFDHFKVEIEDVDVHFIHERASPDPSATIIPILLLHGWPGSFYEFLDCIKPLAHPGNLSRIHFDVVVASQPGYTFSSGARGVATEAKSGKARGIHSGRDGDLLMQDVARIMDKLMVGLGYRHYAVQAGDWASMVLRCMAIRYPERVRAVHLNFCPSVAPAIRLPLVPPSWTPRWLRTLPQLVPKAWYASPIPVVGRLGDAAWSAAHYATLGAVPAPPTAEDRERMWRGIEFVRSGQAYAQLQATRPSTLGLCLSRSPLANLAYLAEKWLDWSDDSCLDDADILTSLTLWELTGTLPRSLYPYRNRPPQGMSAVVSDPRNYIGCPVGFSDFNDIISVPRNFVEASVNLRWWRRHRRGGHFAAFEVPHEFTRDLQDCFAVIWPH